MESDVLKNMSIFIFSSVSDSGVAPLCARASADTDSIAVVPFPYTSYVTAASTINRFALIC